MTAAVQTVRARPCACASEGPTRNWWDRRVCLPRQGIRKGCWRRQAGQHMGEYAILMGLVAAATIGMQVYARTAISTGVKAVSDHYASVEIADKVVIKVQKSTVTNVVPKGTIDAA